MLCWQFDRTGGFGATCNNQAEFEERDCWHATASFSVVLDVSCSDALLETWPELSKLSKTFENLNGEKTRKTTSSRITDQSSIYVSARRTGYWFWEIVCEKLRNSPFRHFSREWKCDVHLDTHYIHRQDRPVRRLGSSSHVALAKLQIFALTFLISLHRHHMYQKSSWANPTDSAEGKDGRVSNRLSIVSVRQGRSAIRWVGH